MSDQRKRCSWCEGNELYEHYHDTEWGVPTYDDQTLFEMLNLEGAVITIDAMGTQKAIAEDICVSQGDYILSVKGNQGRLHDEIRDQFDFATRQLDFTQLDPIKWTVAKSETIGHDRNETRGILVCHNLDWMDGKIRGAWKGLANVIMVHRKALLSSGKHREDISYYMSSLQDGTAEDLLHYTRGHWSIENSWHWVLYAIYREGHNQTRERKAASNLSTLCRMALNACNKLVSSEKKKKSLPKRELRALKYEDYLERLLSLVWGPGFEWWGGFIDRERRSVRDVEVFRTAPNFER